MASMIKKSDPPIIKEYIKYFDDYSKKFGKDKTVILMQVGSFYECYCTNDKGPNLHQLSKLLNITLTKKNKSIDEINLSNPFMLGFPTISVQKFLNIIIDNKYYAILVDQYNDFDNITKKVIFKRKVTNIYTPGNYIDNIISPDSKNIMSIFITQERQLNGTFVFVSGYSYIDLSTGTNYINDILSSVYDPSLALDKVVKQINALNPIEIIVITDKLVTINLQSLLQYLELQSDSVLHFTHNKIYENLQYQNELLKEVFDVKSLVSPIEYLQIDRYIYGLQSYIYLLNYIKDNNPDVIKNINTPNLFENDCLELSSNAINHLNIMKLFDIINYTSTSIGRRYLKHKITNPITNITQLNQSYDIITELRKIKHGLQDKLGEMIDVERYQRRIGLKKIQPFEFYNLYSSYLSFRDIITYVQTNLPKMSEMIKINVNEFNQYIGELENHFDLELMKNLNMDTDVHYFKKGIFNDLDGLENEIKEYYGFIDGTIETFTNLIKKETGLIETGDEKLFIKTEITANGKISLQLTKRRGDVLTKVLNKMKTLTINSVEINPNTIQIVNNKKNISEIFFKDLDEVLINLENKKKEICGVIMEKYFNTLIQFYNKYQLLFIGIVNTIAEIDFHCSGAICSVKLSYNRPIIEEKENSYVKATQLRHPIIERLNINTLYIPNDVNLGLDFDGMLLYGLNSAGKSSYMKSIGLSIILAQIGYYVPAISLTYMPFKNLFTRIGSNDNLFKGLSSFSLEMVELQAILKRSGSNTLVLCDEICASTESKSALIIIMAMIEMLAKTKTKFISATHLHELVILDRMDKLENVKIYHMDVHFDHANDTLIYTRQLKEGSGSNFYGLTVARYLIHNREFIELTERIKHELDQSFMKKSKYNASLVMSECAICHYKPNTTESIPLETHHIVEQKRANDDNMVEVNNRMINMNDMNNLVVLCKSCHKMVDGYKGKQLIINGYIQTSKGRVLDYKIDEFEITDEKLKEYVNEIKESKVNCSKKLIIEQLREIRGIDLSLYKLNKLIKS